MKIIMLKTRYGSEDGFAVRLFHQNQEYEVADSLGAYFVRVGVAMNKEKDSRLRGNDKFILGEKNVT